MADSWNSIKDKPAELFEMGVELISVESVVNRMPFEYSG